MLVKKHPSARETKEPSIYVLPEADISGFMSSVRLFNEQQQRTALHVSDSGGHKGERKCDVRTPTVERSTYVIGTDHDLDPI